MISSKKKILAVASAGGHWQQLQRLRKSYDHHDIHFVTTMKGLAEQSMVKNYSIVPECNANEKFQIIKCTFFMLKIIIKYRPKVILSTGALPGFIALFIGKLFGCRTLWIDSVANAEEYSKAGRYARYCADIRLSQWPNVVDSEGGEFAGNLL